MVFALLTAQAAFDDYGLCIDGAFCEFLEIGDEMVVIAKEGKKWRVDLLQGGEELEWAIAPDIERARSIGRTFAASIRN